MIKYLFLMLCFLLLFCEPVDMGSGVLESIEDDISSEIPIIIQYKGHSVTGNVFVLVKMDSSVVCTVYDYTIDTVLVSNNCIQFEWKYSDSLIFKSCYPKKWSKYVVENDYILIEPG